MSKVAGPTEERQRADAIGRRYLVRFEEDTLRQRPLWIRLIIEFFGAALLVLVAAGAGVINRYAGGNPISRTAAVVAPGAIVMALIYAWGPLSGLHINPAVTIAFAARRVFRPSWVAPYIVAQLAGAIVAALFLQLVFGHVAAGGTYPIAGRGGEWKSLVMEIVLTMILVTVILNTATGYRSIGHNAALAVGATVALLGLFASPISGASMNPARSLGPDIVGRRLHWLVGIRPRSGCRGVHCGDAHRAGSGTARQGGARGRRRRSAAAVTPVIGRLASGSARFQSTRPRRCRHVREPVPGRSARLPMPAGPGCVLRRRGGTRPR